MRIVDIIAAKRDGTELGREEIRRIVLDYSAGLVPDYQVSAFLMAVCIRGMSFQETAAMTMAMVDSGKRVDLSDVSGIKVDKHSTGGVGDKTTLVVVPMLAACGLKAAKMSGRGLGFTGGTLDKLQSIPGLTTNLSRKRFVAQLNDIGAAIAGQSRDIVPADKKIYALRDVTATVESMPLIAASVMSKKIACSTDVILLDVKVGSGALVGDIESARQLARTMIAIGAGKNVAALITDMNQPLGAAVGNSLEVIEAIETLKGGGPDDLRLLCIELCAGILYISGESQGLEEARAAAVSSLESGAALGKFREIVAAQGGDPGVVDDSCLLGSAAHRVEALTDKSGWVERIHCSRIGLAAGILGAGRQRKADQIDPVVGVMVNKKLGDRVERGETLAVIHANDPGKATTARDIIVESYSIGDARPEPPPLVHERLGTGG